MNCGRVRELLPRYADGDLEGAERAAVRQHLAECAACRQREALHGRLATALAELPPIEGEAAVAERLRRRVCQGVEKGRRSASWWRRAGAMGNALSWAMVSALAILLVAALALTWRPLIEPRIGRSQTPLANQQGTETSAAQTTATPTPMPPTTPTLKGVQPSLTPPEATLASPGTPLPALRYTDPVLGISAEYLAGWTVMAATPPATEFLNGRPALGVTFESPHDDALPYDHSSHSIQVSMQDAAGQSLAQAVNAWLDPIVPQVRDTITQRSLTVAGEPAVELTLPMERWGARTVWIVHEGRAYVIRLSPVFVAQPAGQAGFDLFLGTLAFTPIAVTATPAPFPTPAPTPSPVPPGQAQLPIASLVVTPGEPPVLYAVIDGRLYRSGDRGNWWAEESQAGLPGEVQLKAVTIDYRHPATMYVVTDQGIFRREGEANWSLVNTLKASTLAVDLTDPNVLWAGVYRTSETNAAILKSEDAGRTWGKADYGIDLERSWTTDILVDPNNPNILWAAVRTDGGREWSPGEVYRGGRDGHWERLSLGQFEPLYTNVDSCYIAGIAYDPNANLLFAGCDLSYYNQGNMLLLRSPNADAADSSTVRWEVAARLGPVAAAATGMVRPLAADAREPRSLYVIVRVDEPGQPQRLSIAVSHDGGQTWEPLSQQGVEARN